MERYFREGFRFEELPQHVKKLVNNSKEVWVAKLNEYHFQRQTSWNHETLLSSVFPQESTYYQELIKFNKRYFVLFPYHLHSILVKCGIRETPFKYYGDILQEMIKNERSYDALPNFTAVDIVRVVGVGRNEYIDIMNKVRSRSSWNFKRRKHAIPQQPVAIKIQPWWEVKLEFIINGDIRTLDTEEVEALKRIEEGRGTLKAGIFAHNILQKLYTKQMIHFNVPLSLDSRIHIPPLEGFIMNRSSSDFIETLLYQIFVSLDESLTVKELAALLEIQSSFVQIGFSLYCRLGFAELRGIQTNIVYHSTWKPHGITTNMDVKKENTTSLGESKRKRIAFVFDSTLTAFLMMGNLAEGLKSHAVTLFEVGKLPDENMDTLLSTLGGVLSLDDEHTHYYYSHATILKKTIEFLRSQSNCKVDLIRAESISNLETSTRNKIFSLNYHILLFMCPFTMEAHPRFSTGTYTFGPPIPEFNSAWFKFFLYSLTGKGPKSVLYPIGYRVDRIPEFIKDYTHVLVSQWDSEPIVAQVDRLLPQLNDYLLTSPTLVQAFNGNEPKFHYEAFPFSEGTTDCPIQNQLLDLLQKKFKLANEFGVAKFIEIELDNWVPFNISFGIPLFDGKTNEEVLKTIRERFNHFEDEQALKFQLENQRFLILELLGFIEKYQCLEWPGYFQELEMSRGLSSGCKIYPTKLLCWDGIAISNIT